MTQQEQDAIKVVLSPLAQPVIVEAGAGAGDETFDFERLLNKPFRHVLIEPDPRNAQHILDHVGPTAYEGRSPRPLGPMRRLILGAISDSCGWRPFHFSESDNGSHTSGSLLEPSGHLQAFPHIKFPNTGMVACWTLDEIFRREYLSRIDLLFVDIQGSEAALIRGGRNALTHTQYLFCEAETIELYRGQAMKSELLDMLPGWDVIGQFPQETFESNLLLRNTAYVPCA